MVVSVSGIGSDDVVGARPVCKWTSTVQEVRRDIIMYRTEIRTDWELFPEAGACQISRPHFSPR